MGYFNYKEQKIYYREAGKGDLLIILPGNTASSIAHLNEIEYFKDRYHAVSMDFLGTGLSERVEKWDTNWWRECAKQVNELISHLGYEQAIVMGTSGGAIISLNFASMYPKKCKAIIADSCMAHCNEEMVRKNVVEERAMLLEEQKQFWGYCHGTDWQKVVAADTDMMIRFSKEDGDWYKGELKKIICPVLLTGSKQDELLDNYETQTAEMLKEIKLGSGYIHYKGSHPLMWSEQKLFRSLADQFLNIL